MRSKRHLFFPFQTWLDRESPFLLIWWWSESLCTESNLEIKICSYLSLPARLIWAADLSIARAPYYPVRLFSLRMVWSVLLLWVRLVISLLLATLVPTPDLFYKLGGSDDCFPLNGRYIKLVKWGTAQISKSSSFSCWFYRSSTPFCDIFLHYFRAEAITSLTPLRSFQREQK